MTDLRVGMIARCDSTCAVADCPKPARSRGWCSRHYARWQRHGDVETVLNGRGRSITDRFWSKVQKSDGCWLWLGRASSRYGTVRLDDGKWIDAHRFAWIEYKGPVPDGLELDHLCRVSSCVNPGHLEAVSHRENLLRGQSPIARNARKTHCKRGHPFDPQNTFIDRRGCRQCRPCRMVRRREAKARKQ